MENKSKYIQVSTTVEKRSDAERIARMLSENKLSACTQIIGPIGSVYRWRGKIKKSKEWLCVAKSKRGYYGKIEQAIKKIHPYELPEIIATPIIEGSREYLGWIQKELNYHGRN
ncbi:MAG TPA: divalent-cation tolerance protein CutA [Candidatus Paceibacterota bacterium]